MDDADSTDSAHSSVRIGEPALRQALAALEEFDQSELWHQEGQQQQQQQHRSQDYSTSRTGASSRSTSHHSTRARESAYQERQYDLGAENDDPMYVGEHLDERSPEQYYQHHQQGDDDGDEYTAQSGSVPRRADEEDSQAQASAASLPQALNDTAEDDAQYAVQDGESQAQDVAGSEPSRSVSFQEAEDAAHDAVDAEEGEEEEQHESSGGVDATVIYNPDVSLLPPVLRPAWQRASPERPAYQNPFSSTPRRDGPSAEGGRSRSRSPNKNRAFYEDQLGGDIFSPSKLQRMFQPPTPPSVDESASPSFTRDAHSPPRATLEDIPLPAASALESSRDEAVSTSDAAPRSDFTYPRRTPSPVVESSRTQTPKREDTSGPESSRSTSAHPAPNPSSPDAESSRDETAFVSQLNARRVTPTQSFNSSRMTLPERSSAQEHTSSGQALGSREPTRSFAGDNTSADEGEVEAQLGSLNEAHPRLLERLAEEEETALTATPKAQASEDRTARSPSPPHSPTPQPATPEPPSLQQTTARISSESRTNSNAAGLPFTPLTPRRPMKLFGRGTPIFVFRASPSPGARTSASRSSQGSGGSGPRFTIAARHSDRSTSGEGDAAGPHDGRRFEIGTDARTPSEFVRKLQRMRSKGRVRGSAQRSSVRADRLGARRVSHEVDEVLEEEDEEDGEGKQGSAGAPSRSTSGPISSASPSPSAMRSKVLRRGGNVTHTQTPRQWAAEAEDLSQREQKRMKIGVESSALSSRRNSLEREAEFLARSTSSVDPGVSHSRRMAMGRTERSTDDESGRPVHLQDDSEERERGHVYLSPRAEQQARVAWDRASMGPVPYKSELDQEHTALGTMPGMRLGMSAGPPRDYVREAPSFLQLVRQQGLGSDAMTLTTNRSGLESGLDSRAGSGSGSATPSVVTSGSGPMSRTMSASSEGMLVPSASTSAFRSRASRYGSQPHEETLQEEVDEGSADGRAAEGQPEMAQFSFQMNVPADSSKASVARTSGPRYPSSFGREISEDEVDAALGPAEGEARSHLGVSGDPRRVQSSPGKPQARSPSKTVTFAQLSPRRVAFTQTVGPQPRQSPRKLLRQFSAAAEVEWEMSDDNADAMQDQDLQQGRDVPLGLEELSMEPSSEQRSQNEELAAQIQAVIGQKTSGANSDPMRKSALVHISPEEFNMPMEALETVLGQGRMTFDRAAGRWIKSKSRSRANSEADKRSLATSVAEGQQLDSHDQRPHRTNEPDPARDANGSQLPAPRRSTGHDRSGTNLNSTAEGSNDSTPDPFINIESFSHSGRVLSRPMQEEARAPSTSSQAAELSRDVISPPNAEASRSGWPRESTPVIMTPSASAGTGVTEQAGPQPSHTDAPRQAAPSQGSAQGWRTLPATGGSHAYANRPKFSSLLRQEVKLMQSASTASSAGSDAGGPMSPARLLDVAAALAQDGSFKQSTAGSPLSPIEPVVAHTSPSEADVAPQPMREQNKLSTAKPQSSPSRSFLKPILVNRSPTKSALASSPRPSPTKNGSDDTRRSISFADFPQASEPRPHPRPDDYSSVESVDEVLRGPGSPAFAESDDGAADLSVGQVSARTLEIAQALQHLAELTLTQDDPRAHEVPEPSALALRSHTNVLSAQRTAGRGDNAGDMTLATNASFSVARDRIVELIADVAPWEEHWEEMDEIDLSDRRVETVLRLRDFCPALLHVNIGRNEISYLSGLPSGVRTLKSADNRLSNMTLFDHLKHLEVLDISGNQLSSLRNLDGLARLRDLKANDNIISDLRGLSSLTALRRLSLRGNKLTQFDANVLNSDRLERLDLSRNSIQLVASLYRLRGLRDLNLDHNNLSSIDLGPKMPHLRVLRLSFNPALAHLSVSPVKRLNTLYVDGCALSKVEHLSTLNGLENFSIRQQVTGAIQWRADETRDAKRLFFSGNAFHGGLLGHRDIDGNQDDPADVARVAKHPDSKAGPFGSRKRAHPDTFSARYPEPQPFTQPVTLFTLVYLELSGCQLTALPAALPQQLPNLRHLNLDHNLLTTLPSLQALTRLKRLSLVGCRVWSSQSILKAVQGLPELLVLDSRMNPCTLGLYPPVIVVSSLASGSSPGGFGGHSRGGCHLAEAALPPFPNPEIAQPDVLPHQLRKAQRKQQDERRRAEKSFFHKRSAAPESLGASSGEDSDDDDDEGSTITSTATHEMGHRDATREREEPSRKRRLERAAAAAASSSATAGQARAGGDHKNVAGHGGSSTTSSALFLASDARFLKTLPIKFTQRRQAHRGLLALACPALVWLDGLVVEWAEVEIAQDFVAALRADREEQHHQPRRGGAAAAGAADADADDEDDDDDDLGAGDVDARATLRSSVPSSTQHSWRHSAAVDESSQGQSADKGTETLFWESQDVRPHAIFNSLP
ncbi:hypothetical protein V8E36_001655 [Tilletia maclaganii]